MKKALICGISGQDGAYLAKLLLEKGYKVYGTSRDAQLSEFSSLKKLGIHKNIELESMSIVDFRSVIQVIKRVKPDEIYNLAGQTSVGLSFEQPVETMESISIGTLNILEAIRFLEQPIRFYNAASGECFGDTGEKGANENTPFRPKSPYAVAKTASFFEITSYRESYGLYACSGLLFNHESPLRPSRFVTKKIISTIARIHKGSKEKLQLGNIEINRDWGWAPEYVEAMHLMLQQEKADDYVVATGQCNSLKDFIDTAFRSVGLDWHDYVIIDKTLLRPSDHLYGVGNPQKAADKLGWKAKYKMEDIIRMILEDELIK
jgi:GDPmannose 4,6-dehydratase